MSNMTINLTKGGVVNLTKEAGGNLRTVELTLGWSENTTDGDDFDPDVVAFVVGADGNLVSPEWFIHAFPDGTPLATAPDGSVEHSGDDRTGGTGETITIHLDKLPRWCEKVVGAVTIFKAASRKQNFGVMGDCSITVVNADTGAVMAKGELSFENSTFTAVNYCALERHGNDWALRVLGEGYNGGLAGLCQDHGLTVAANEYDN